MHTIINGSYIKPFQLDQSGSSTQCTNSDQNKTQYRMVNPNWINVNLEVGTKMLPCLSYKNQCKMVVPNEGHG